MTDRGTIGSAPLVQIAATNNPIDATGAQRHGDGSHLPGAAYSGPFVTVSGTVKINETPVARIVRAYRRRDGFLLGEATSDGATGAFIIDCLGFAGPVYVLALDESSAGQDYNAQIFDLVTPA